MKDIPLRSIGNHAIPDGTTRNPCPVSRYDFFVGQALTGILSNNKLLCIIISDNQTWHESVVDTAKQIAKLCME